MGGSGAELALSGEDGERVGGGDGFGCDWSIDMCVSWNYADRNMS
jgi:hypothetical protein